MVQSEVDQTTVQDQAQEQKKAEQFVVFRIGDRTLLSTLDSIDEITDVMPINPVPATWHWFLGLGARNGQLLPVSDLTDYIGVEKSGDELSRRLLIVCQQNEFFGLAVDEVMGLITDDEMSVPDESGELTDAVGTESVSEIDARLTPLLAGDRELRGLRAAMIDLPRLLEQPDFVSIGVEG